MRRWFLIVVLALVTGTLGLAAELEDLGKQVIVHPNDPAALQAAQTILQKYPLGDETTHNPRLLNYGAAEIYAACAVVVGKDLLLHQAKPLEALALCDLYLKVFPGGLTGFWPPQVYELIAKSAAAAGLPPEQALERMEALGTYVLDRGKLFPATALFTDLLTLYQTAGKKAEGRRFVEELPFSRPDVVELPGYWKTRVGMYMGAGENDKAKQAAVWGYRLTPMVADPGKDDALQQLLRTLAVTDGTAGIEGFLTYLKTGTGTNPLAAIGVLPITEAQREQLETATGGNWGLAVDARLLQGQFTEALQGAQVQALSEGATAQAGVTNIARCFKAKDMHCVRANEYLQWVKSGQGTNPVGTF
ncbi:MAG: hypothetical protein GX100_07215 [candidate division WS1 bacterium]|nr:hypothetical protein [candidate division WS1 bacterium]